MPITKATASSIAPAAKGDLVVGSATNDASVLAVGSANQVLTVDSSTSTGLKWAAAATGSLTLITTTTVSTAVADITFSSIPSTYQHLSIIFSGRSNKGGNYVDNLRIQLNGVTSSNYQNLYAGGFSSMTVTNAGTTTFADLRYISAEGLMTNGEQGTGIIYFPDYKLTTLKKMIHWETRGVADSPAWFSGQSKLNFTTAVSSIKLFLDGGSFMTGTTASLYGWS